MRRAAFALTVAAAVLLACSDDATGDDTTPTTTTTHTNPVCGGDAADAAPAIARSEFANDPDVTWTVLGSRLGGLGTVLIEIQAEEEGAGLPSLTLVFACGTGRPEHLATYAQSVEGDEHVLLSTTDAAEGIDFAPVLEE